MIRSGLCMPVLVGLAAPAWAQVHATDVILEVQNGRIVTGRVENGEPVFPRYAYSSELGALGIPNAATEPGFDSDPGAFAPQTLVGVSVLKALRRWNGADFDEIPPERLRLTKGVSIVETPTADPPVCVVAGSLALGLSNGAGVLHQHPGYELLDPAGDGVYLLELIAWMGKPGGGASDPFWILFSQNESAEVVDEAVSFVEQVLACRADFNRDGALTIADFGAFQTGFVLKDPRADFNGDCNLTIADFGAFQTAFVTGCR